MKNRGGGGEQARIWGEREGALFDRLRRAAERFMAEIAVLCDLRYAQPYRRPAVVPAHALSVHPPNLRVRLMHVHSLFNGRSSAPPPSLGLPSAALWRSAAHQGERLSHALIALLITYPRQKFLP